jgi:hypothetical protein
MENEFGTKNDDEVIVKILEKGNVQETEVNTFPYDAASVGGVLGCVGDGGMDGC